jgi:hypothetical protein
MVQQMLIVQISLVIKLVLTQLALMIQISLVIMLVIMQQMLMRQISLVPKLVLTATAYNSNFFGNQSWSKVQQLQIMQISLVVMLVKVQ